MFILKKETSIGSFLMGQMVEIFKPKEERMWPTFKVTFSLLVEKVLFSFFFAFGMSSSPLLIHGYQVLEAEGFHLVMVDNVNAEVE